jgi:heme oxygenase
MWSALEAGTRDCHVAADAPWHELAHGELTLRTYQDHLVLVYGFEAPVEAALALTARVGLLTDLRARSRASWIVQDLLALGLRPAKLARMPQCTEIVPFRDPAEALGWLYVVERSTANHEALSHAIARALPTAPLAYLSTHGVVARREALNAALEHVAPDEATFARVIEAARTAFDCYVEWFEGDVRLSSPTLVVAR